MATRSSSPSSVVYTAMIACCSANSRPIDSQSSSANRCPSRRRRLPFPPKRRMAHDVVGIVGGGRERVIRRNGASRLGEPGCRRGHVVSWHSSPAEAIVGEIFRQVSVRGVRSESDAQPIGRVRLGNQGDRMSACDEFEVVEAGSRETPTSSRAATHPNGRRTSRIRVPATATTASRFRSPPVRRTRRCCRTGRLFPNPSNRRSARRRRACRCPRSNTKRSFLQSRL